MAPTFVEGYVSGGEGSAMRMVTLVCALVMLSSSPGIAATWQYNQKANSLIFQSAHDDPPLILVQAEDERRGKGSFIDQSGGAGGSAGGGAGGSPEIAYGVFGILLVTLVVNGGRWLWNRFKRLPLITAAEDVDVVEFSVFGPRTARPGNEIMIVTFLHLPEDRKRATFLAKAMDFSAILRARCPEITIMRGETVEISCAVSTLVVDEPVQAFVWQGRPTSCQFLVTIPEGTSGRSFFAVVRLSVNGNMIGRMKFRISSDPNAADGQKVGWGDLRRYEKPFVSYATRDRKEVLKRVQMLQIMKTKYFMDLLSLDPGDRWKKKLFKRIDRCDLFLLFWSQAAKDSQWVLQEAEYALKLQQGNPNCEPDIVPVILEQDVSPPVSLAQLNFNDRIHYLISQMDRAEASDANQT
jgi:hypothetical protein